MTASISIAAPSRTDLKQFLTEAIEDPRNGWSIGTFGAIGEFVRDVHEPLERVAGSGTLQMVSPRGGIRIVPVQGLRALAYDTLSGDGETWGNAIAFCLPKKTGPRQDLVRRLGPDSSALRPQDRKSILYDLGVGLGHVSMCVRTLEPELTGVLDALVGKRLLSVDGKSASELIQKRSPTRVMISAGGRVEVYGAIPPSDGKSPDGPHTHLLPKLIASERTHSANAPIPEGLQPVLMLHPRSPWRDVQGRRTPFDAELDREFDHILALYGLEEDRRVRSSVEAAIAAKWDPDRFDAPSTRRGRIQLRITLRRLAHKLGSPAVSQWQARFEPAALGDDEADIPPR